MFSHILVPLDTSTFAEAALPYAESMAEKFGAKITLVSVIESPLYLTDEFNVSLQIQDELRSHAVVEARQYLQKMATQLRQLGHEVAFKVIMGGGVAKKIVETAVLVAADAIVMSTHGRSGVGRWLLGSVADRIIHIATIPIVLVRGGQAATIPDLKSATVSTLETQVEVRG
ncbi:MAG: universal stress protein [Chloroflexota bacterium]